MGEERKAQGVRWEQCARRSKRSARLGAVANDGKQRGLAAATGPHQRQHLAGLTASSDVKQDLHSTAPSTMNTPVHFKEFEWHMQIRKCAGHDMCEQSMGM